MSREMVEIDCTVVQETKAAYLILVAAPGRKNPIQEWIPKSQVDDYCADTVNGKEVINSVFIPVWLATEKGLV